MNLASAVRSPFDDVMTVLSRTNGTSTAAKTEPFGRRPVKLLIDGVRICEGHESA